MNEFITADLQLIRQADPEVADMVLHTNIDMLIEPEE